MESVEIAVQKAQGFKEIKNEYRISNKEFRIMKFFPSIFVILYSIFCGSIF